MRALPPLGGLKAFESAARLGSFRAAAAELEVTPGAVSQQVKALEERLGVRLFDRGAHSLALTAAGQQYLPVLRDAFDAIAMATAGLGAGPARTLVELTAPAIFAAGWLLPRLERFQAAHRDVELRLRNSNRLLTPGTENVDAAIRHGRAGWGGLGCVHLFGDALVAVCSPETAAGLAAGLGGAPERGRAQAAGLHRSAGLHGFAGLRRSSGLRHAALLETVPEGDARTRSGSVTPNTGQPEGATPWDGWQAVCGIAGPARQRIVLGDEGLTVQAALNGLGVALVDQHMVEGPLREGRLVLPFDVPPWRRGTAWYLVHALAREHDPAFLAVRDWMLAEVGGGEM